MRLDWRWEQPGNEARLEVGTALDRHLSQDDIKGGENVEPVLPKNTLCREREHSSHTNYHSTSFVITNMRNKTFTVNIPACFTHDLGKRLRQGKLATSVRSVCTICSSI